MLFFSGASLIAVFTTGEFAGAAHHHQRNARPRDERLQLRFRGGMPMGNLLTGWLVPLFSAPLVLAVNGLVLMRCGTVLPGGATSGRRSLM